MPSTQVVGKLTAQAAQELGLVAGIPVVSGGGDVACAQIGSGAISPGRVHLYLGTSAWASAVTDSLNLEAEGLAPSANCDPTTFLLGGEMDNAGGCLKWFAENLLGKQDEEAARQMGVNIFAYLDRKALETPPGAEGLLFLPWMWGERSPLDDDLVRGGFAMLGLNHTKWHMGRAILEGIGHHMRWIFAALEKAGIPPRDVNVIGGGAASKIWLQILADVTNVRLRQVEGPLDACAHGAAMTAAVGLGFYKDFQEVEKVIRLTGNEFSPNPDFPRLVRPGLRQLSNLSTRPSAPSARDRWRWNRISRKKRMPGRLCLPGIPLFFGIDYAIFSKRSDCTFFRALRGSNTCPFMAI